MKVDVVLLVEHVARELDIACAIKHLIECRHGLSLVLATRYHDIEKTLRRYEPQAVVVPYCYAGGPWSDVLSRWPNIPYINLAYEQLFSTLTSGYKIPKGVFPKERVLHVGWGDFYRDHLLSHGVQPQNIVVNGNPSYALYRKPYSRYFDTRDDLALRHGLDSGRRWVFVPENFGIVFVEPDRLKGYAGAMGEDKVRVWRENTVKSFQEVARWWRAAAESGGVEVIVRPRPAIPDETFRAGVVEAIGPLPTHLHILKDGTVKEWNLASDLVLSNYSTTLVEAAVAGKPVFMLEPLPFPDFVRADWHDLVGRLKTQAEFLEATKHPPADASRALKRHAEELMMAHGDAIGNLADLIADVVLLRRPVPPVPGIECLPEEIANVQPVRKACWAVRYLLGRVKEAVLGQQIDTWHKDDILDQADLARRMARWKYALDPERVGT